MCLHHTRSSKNDPSGQEKTVPDRDTDESHAWRVSMLDSGSITADGVLY
jgi:hypothetical protein